MKKYTFIGEERVLARWIYEFPDLINYIGDFVELDISTDTQLKNFINKRCGENEIIIASSSYMSDNVNALLSERGSFSTIKDFVANRVTNSELMPKKLRMEASTLCQLKCKSCYMRLNNNGTMKAGYLSFENFRKLIDNSPFIREIELSNSGEIFLNPDLIRIMEYSYEKGVKLMAYNGTNFNTVTDEQLEAMVKYRFSGITISIDGASQDVYSIYRIGGNFNKVIDNIVRLMEYKKIYKADVPKIRWQYIIMEHNEEDVPMAKTKALELGIPIDFKLTWDDSYVPKNVEMLRRETGLQELTRRDYIEETSKAYLGYLQCRQMFVSPQINWDGRLLGCCGLFMEDYNVNVFKVGLRSALKTSAFIRAKKGILNNVSLDSVDRDCPCYSCEKRLQMLEASELFRPFDNIVV